MATTVSTTDSDPKLEKSMPSELTLSPQAPVYDVPDGGVKAWMTVAGAFLVAFCSSGYVNSFGVYEDFFVREYLSQHSSSQISLIGSVQVLLLGCLGIPSGFAMDQGYFYIVMIIGSFITVFSQFMMSLTHEQSFWQVFLSLGLGLGIGVGTIYVPAVGIVAHHFKRRRSLMMGVVGSGISIGGVVHPIMLNNFIHGSIGFRWGVRISAFFNLALLVIANLLMSTRLPTRLKDVTFAKYVSYWKSFFNDAVYVLATLSIFILYAGLYFPTFFLQLAAIDAGLSEDLAFYTISIFNGLGAFGRLLPTIIVDRTGVFNLIIPCAVSCGILIFCWVAMKNIAGVISMAVLYGFVAGAVISLIGPMIAYLTDDMSEIGARLGVSIGIGAVGALIGPPISGALLTADLEWLRPVLFSGICCVASGCTLTLAKVLSDRKRRKLALPC